ncbi:hypothetical protein HCN44_000852 [Aphidius gifuensis]|uniref:Uncharacterized protein n=1 Tax=Aphidius gifuensis TaxID=684658 RepID=A0A834XM35_APHGI|nr:hypothetical protein HCN44_000852 [Aphidius gifuensis]
MTWHNLLDGRGRFPPKNKLSENAHELVLEHIRLLPLTPAHYVRHNSTRVYVEGNISQAKAYRLYEASALSKNQQPERQMLVYFYTWDKSDQDDQQDEYNTHLIRKDRARAEKIKDEELSKTNKTMMTACFDLQAILFSPVI